MKYAVVPRLLRLPLCLVSAWFALGCGSDEEFQPAAPFADAEDVKVWATAASAVSVYSHVYELVAVADGELAFSDPACPRTTDDGTTLTVEGGCVDGSDREWEGRATFVRDQDGITRTIILDGLNGNDGTATLTQVSATQREVEAELVIGGVTTIVYSLTVEGEYAGPTTWNGSGRVTREGVIQPLGSVDATTVDEVVDDARCSGQPVSGSTTLHARGDTAVVTYDGATDCDSDKNARLVVNGKDRGLISGIGCSLGAHGSGRSGVAATLAVALAALAVRLRRRRPAARG